MFDKLRYSLIRLLAGKRQIAINLTIKDGVLDVGGKGFMYNTYLSGNHSGVNSK